MEAIDGVRPARRDDVGAIVALVHELAEYEREPAECGLTPAQLTEALFGTDPWAGALVAVDPPDGSPGDDVVGAAIWFRTFSTWKGVPGIHLEDLYVRPAHRGRGHGGRLLAALARICDERGWARLEWDVLDWNTPAVEFYRSLGARPKDGWSTFRLTGPELAAVARRAGQPAG